MHIITQSHSHAPKTTCDLTQAHTCTAFEVFELRVHPAGGGGPQIRKWHAAVSEHSLPPARSTNKGTVAGIQTRTHTHTWLNIGAAFGLFFCIETPSPHNPWCSELFKVVHCCVAILWPLTIDRRFTVETLLLTGRRDKGAERGCFSPPPLMSTVSVMTLKFTDTTLQMENDGSFQTSYESKFKFLVMLFSLNTKC